MFLCEVGNLMLVVMRSLVKLQWVSQLKGKTRLALPRATSFFNGTGGDVVSDAAAAAGSRLLSD